MSRNITITSTWVSQHEITVEDGFVLPEDPTQLPADIAAQVTPEGAALLSIQ